MEDSYDVVSIGLGEENRKYKTTGNLPLTNAVSQSHFHAGLVTVFLEVATGIFTVAAFSVGGLQI